MATLKRALWPSVLKKKGVELVDRVQALAGKPKLRCIECGQTWDAPDPRERYTDNYFRCPNGCNINSRPL
jgi:hypothetical protein